MSGIYNVFLKWAPADKSQTAAWGRHHLTFANRYEADEFYRLLQTVRNANLPMFAGLTRASPQFWSHSGLLWHSVHDVQALGLADDFRTTLSTVLINDGQVGGRTFDLIENAVTGPDWVSGGTFFVRNRRQRELYWCVHGGYVHTSEEKRTKFRVELEETPEGQEGKMVLVRGDRVVVSVVQEAYSVELGDRKYLGVEDFDGGQVSRLALVSTPHVWTFGDLVLKKVGVRWEDVRDGSGNVESRPTLVPMSEGGEDEWELC
ncbi:hypothetical protein QBC34DRAFT_478348 [Podospora aff. communis PSN243]|uniref:Uncharacterized protein n=1 Tax=Podospora aff. communis PSN243 TaxID=3040156 RepID=A0AAV9G7W3_9PEZI|nr:hypothetical protein QBC34DRAFT_478348 [Podospora aff. communis PSN243]